ncbi:tellurite resistance TerB family protein [Oligella ureolytica]
MRRLKGQSSRALIAAIILAARADGHVDAEEQAFIEQQTQNVATAEEELG